MKRGSYWKIKVGAVIVTIILLSVGVVGYFLWQKYAEEDQHYADGELQITTQRELQEQNEDSDTPISEVTDSDLLQEVSDECLDEQSGENRKTDTAQAVDELLQSMNLEAKVAQLFMTSPEELTDIGIAVQAGATTKRQLKAYPVGGLIFAEQNFQVLDQMQLMINSTKVYSRYPIFLAMDEAGTARITNSKNTLEEVGFNLQYIEKEFQTISEIDISKDLQIQWITDENVVEVLQGNADMVVVDAGFYNHYQSVVDAVRNGTFASELLEEKVRKILTYKVQNHV